MYFNFLYSAFSLVILNIFLIGFLIINGISNRYEIYRRNTLKKLVENIIFENSSSKELQKLLRNDLVILESIIFEYLSALKNSIERDRLIELAYKCDMINYYMKLIDKNNIIKKNIACMRLGSLGAKEATSKLLVLLESNTTTLYLNAANALIKINGTVYLYAVLTKLMDFKAHENYALIEKRIMNIIADIKDDIFDTLDRLINSRDNTLILFAIEILSYRKDARANPYIYKLLNHYDENIRGSAQTAAKAMGLV